MEEEEEEEKEDRLCTSVAPDDFLQLRTGPCQHSLSDSKPID